MKRQNRVSRRQWLRGFLVAMTVSALAFAWVGVEKSAASGSRSVASNIKEVYRLALGPGDFLLESILEFIKEHDIKDGVVLTGIGSLSECSLHWPTTVVYPSTNKFETFKGPLEITGIQGIIADGEPHLHMMVAEGGDARAAGGHMEKGCKVLYLAEITIAKLDGPPMTRRPNQYNVRMLQKK